MCARIVPLCVPAVSASAENQLVAAVHCRVTSSRNGDVTTDDDVTADDDDGDGCDGRVYDARCVADAAAGRVNDADAAAMETSEHRSCQARWTLDNGHMPLTVILIIISSSISVPSVL